MKPTSTPRIQYCDFLRFIAIALVVLVHAFADWRDLYLATNRTGYFWLTALESITRIAVPIFFMLTGAFMLGRAKYESYPTFLKKRVSKLIIPFLLISLVYYIYANFRAGTPFSALGFIEAFTSNQIKYHLWFMYTIILIYLLLPFLNKLILNLSQRELRNLILVIFAGNILSFLSTTTSGLIGSSFIFSGDLRFINLLFIGYYLYKYGWPIKWRKLLYAAGIISWICLPILDFIFVKNVRADELFFVASAPLPVIMAIATFVFFQKHHQWLSRRKLIPTILEFITPLVFYIYMVHILILDNVKQFMLNIHSPTRLIETIIFIAIETLLTFVISRLIAIIIHKLIKLFPRLSRKQEKLTL